MDIEISRKKNGTYLITKRIMESKQSKDIQEEISDEGVKSLFNIEFESNVSSKRLFMEQIDGLWSHTNTIWDLPSLDKASLILG